MGADRTTTESYVSQFYGPPPEKEEDPQRNYRRFIAVLRKRRLERKPVVIVIDGKETSVGKSALGITICRDLYPAFGLEHVVYSAQELHECYLQRDPSMILYDDVTGILSNRGARDSELQGLIAATSIVRKNGHGVLFLAPKKELFDGPLLNSLSNYWIFCEERGRGRVHRAFKGAKYRRSQSRVPFDTWNAVTPITWPNLDGDPFFQQYDVRAQERNRDYFRLHALDPTGKLRECRRCRRLGTPYVIATHDCPGSPLPESQRQSQTEDVPTRPATPKCVCAKCGWAWRPRAGGPGSRCPRCRSWDRAEDAVKAATPQDV